MNQAIGVAIYVLVWYKSTDLHPRPVGCGASGCGEESTLGLRRGERRGDQQGLVLRGIASVEFMIRCTNVVFPSDNEQTYGPSVSENQHQLRILFNQPRACNAFMVILRGLTLWYTVWKFGRV
jgi:hypothetical protein